MRLVFSVFILLPGLAMAQLASIVAPPLGVTRVNDPVTFSQQGFDAPRLAGEFDGPVRLTTDRGHLSLSGTAGLAFETGDGEADAEMVFTGTTDAINSALNGLTLAPPMGYAGRATISLSADGQSESWHVAINRNMEPSTARDVILEGVESIHGGVQPGFMVAYGPTAYDIAFYAEGASAGPVVTAASWGEGHVMALPDHQALNMDAYGEQSGTLYRNGISWLGGEGLAVRIVTLSNDVARWLRAQGYENVSTTQIPRLGDALSNADVFVPAWLDPDASDAILDAIGAFVRSGGGLFICDYGVGYDWWWGLPIYRAPGNRLLREAGIGFSSGNRWDEGVVEIVRAEGQVDAEILLNILEDPAMINESTLERGGVLLDRIYDTLAPNDPWARRLDARFGDAIDGIRPTPENPEGAVWNQALLGRELDFLRALAPEDIVAHRTAEDVFGEIPDDAPRVRRVIQIDPAQTRWHSTGLYGVPGELIIATVPAENTNAQFLLRIGGHVDNISPRDEWKRPPEVHWSWALDAERVMAASPFGGALYIDVGTNHRDMDPFEIIIEGAVEAPYFVLGETTDEAWINGLRDAPGPYAELVSERVAISLPSHLIRELDDPTAIMNFWNEVVRLQDELGTHAERRYMAERINIDVQISIGLLHSGYPTQGPVFMGVELVDLDHLQRTGSWGWFHELGHEAQRRPDKTWGSDNAYTFDGSVEATVNIFTVYAYDQMGIREQGGWSWTGAADTVMKRAIEGTELGPYAAIGVGYKLALFLQLRDHFGWPAIQEVFERYNATGTELPQGDAAERDTWLIQVSEVVGHNLSAFMGEVWGLEISEGAQNQVADLPDWMPAVGGIMGTFKLQPNTTVSFDLTGSALAHDDVAEVVEVTEPANGELIMEDGVWIYTPDPGFVGTDAFSYGVRSSTGHVHTSPIEIEVSWRGVTMDTWLGIEGSTIADLRAAPGFPDTPDESKILSAFEIPQNQADEYGVRLRTYLVPPETGDYTFWIASDDAGELWVSPGRDPNTAERVAYVDVWTQYQAWRSTPTQRSAPIALEAGQAYALEALMKEGGGGDHLSVAWSQGDEAPVPIPPEFLFTQAPEAPPEDDAGMNESDNGVENDGGSGPQEDAGATADATTSMPSTDDAGCDCSATESNQHGLWLLLFLVVLRRRWSRRMTSSPK